ncbi:NUDIX hydrolase [Paenibacillus radicis (ex Gao et al. 2016)]|uniref:NUDIX hydrolase n=1 Tax=Paenibacillus radicis (ex Gao et al. 2016) TaxID=1737354 RepID=A0A917M7X9_9BACL|nr:NUDIX domain-containing protein [Paenibacillus radicis (ex Gao et al. 2016)]GGG83200.1 NUDIX hydrolase [Paenibacillus radicis (ex Gao et al. 2016)]
MERLKNRRREFSATVYVLSESRDSLMFVRRRKPPFIGSFLPPGGHLDENETPDEAALREVLEETGYPIKLLSAAQHEPLEDVVTALAAPLAIQLEPIDDEHDHIDFIYLGQVTGDSVELSEEEEGGVWLTVEQLDEQPMPESVRAAAKRILAGALNNY